MSKRNKVPYFFICLLLVVTFSLAGCGKKSTESVNAQAVRSARAAVHDISEQASYTGTVQGKNEADVMSKVSAKVTAVYVHPGDQVTAGQTLITLDSSDYKAAVAQAQAAINQAQAGVATAQTSVKIAQAGVTANNIQAQTALNNLNRAKQLYAAGAVSQQNLEQAQSSYDSLVTGSAEDQVQSAQAAVAAAQAGVGTARAQLQAAEQQVANCTITAPISGIVGSVSATLGNTVGTQNAVAVITDSDQLQVEINVSESDINYIKIGSPVHIDVSAARDEPYTGRVSSISQVADPENKNYDVKVVLNNTDGKIKSGMFAQVDLDTITKPDVLCVPAEAIVNKNGEDIVYIVDKSNHAQMIIVQTGIKNDEYVEIVKGLTAGQEVITKGNTLVDEGTLVRVIAGGDK